MSHQIRGSRAGRLGRPAAVPVAAPATKVAGIITPVSKGPIVPSPVSPSAVSLGTVSSGPAAAAAALDRQRIPILATNSQFVLQMVRTDPRVIALNGDMLALQAEVMAPKTRLTDEFLVEIFTKSYVIARMHMGSENNTRANQTRLAEHIGRLAISHHPDLKSTAAQMRINTVIESLPTFPSVIDAAIRLGGGAAGAAPVPAPMSPPPARGMSVTALPPLEDRLSPSQRLKNIEMTQLASPTVDTPTTAVTPTAIPTADIDFVNNIFG